MAHVGKIAANGGRRSRRVSAFVTHTEPPFWAPAEVHQRHRPWWQIYGANKDSVSVGVRTAGHTGDVDRQAISSPAGRSTPPKAAVSWATAGSVPGSAACSPLIRPEWAGSAGRQR